ncbi:MAG: hypothetical protein AAGL96_04225 [Pseudomonadota bacterium]
MVLSFVARLRRLGLPHGGGSVGLRRTAGFGPRLGRSGRMAQWTGGDAMALYVHPM